MNLLPYNVTTNPYPCPAYVKMWVVSSKLTNTASLSATLINTNFLETGSGTSGLQGNMLDMCFKVNKDHWTVHATKTVKLGLTSLPATATAGYFDNGSFSLPFTFNFGKYFKSMLKYSDDGW